MIKTLSNVVISTPKLEAWCDMAANVVGLHVDVVHPGAAVRLRMDEKIQRLLLLSTDEKPKLVLGFEVEDEAALAKIAQDLNRAGYQVASGTSDEIAPSNRIRRHHDDDYSRRTLRHGCAQLSKLV